MARLNNTDASSSSGNVITGTKKSSSLVIIIAVVIIVAVLGAVIIVLALNSQTSNPSNQTTPRRDVLVTPDNIDEVLAEIQETNPDSAYTASMNIDWYFEDGASPSSNAYIENAVENSRTVYFEVTLADTGEMVYSSPYIPVGSILQNPALTVDLDAGEYSAVCTYHLVDDDYNELSTVSVSVKLHILN